MNAAEYVKWAINQMIQRHPWFGVIAMYIPVKEDPKIETAATDGRILMYCPEFIEKVATEYSPQHVVSLMMHEILHIALKHPSRKMGRIHDLWNIACDIAVDYIIKSSGMPTMEILDPETGEPAYAEFDNLSAEVIYAKLLRHAKIVLVGGPGNHDEWGTCEFDVGTLDQVIRTANAVARRAGKMPGSLESMVDKALAPKVNWREVLHRFVEPKAADYDLIPPDRRYLNEIYDYVYLPDLKEYEEITNIIIAVDTSGSITDDLLSQFLGEIFSIKAMSPTIAMKIITCDCEVHDVFDVDGEMPKITFKGRGGTSFVPVFKDIETKKRDPKALIYLTDAYGNFPVKAPEYPVLWVISNEDEHVIPFGEVVRLV